MEQDESITTRFLNDEQFRTTVAEILVKRVYAKIREEMGVGA